MRDERSKMKWGRLVALLAVLVAICGGVLMLNKEEGEMLAVEQAERAMGKAQADYLLAAEEMALAESPAILESHRRLREATIDQALYLEKVRGQRNP